jgi:hypothetical protein
VRAIDFERAVRGEAFFVTLNACVSAQPGPTAFSNAAAALVERGVPYALGMRLSIPDEDARSLSRLLYASLARGKSVEEAMRQARFLLARSQSRWAVGVPVLYTALREPAPGFRTEEGEAQILESLPPVEAYALPRAEGAFQGRVGELVSLGRRLTGDDRPALLTIHGAGGQGKTALAREAADRFAHAFPGGVWAASLEALLAPDAPGELTPRQQLANDLARFLGALTTPVLKDVTIDYQGPVVAYNATAPVLFAGSELLVLGTFDPALTHLNATIEARTQDGPVTWERQHAIGQDDWATFLPRVVAYHRLQALQDRIDAQAGDTDELVAQATQLSLEHGFVTDHTSLVLSLPEAEPDPVQDPVPDAPDLDQDASTATSTVMCSGQDVFHFTAAQFVFDIVKA